MTWRKFLGPIAVVVLLAGGWRAWGWPGVALLAGGILMWLLLHFTRLMRVLKRASGRPVGYCDSAVMLNAKLRPGVNLLYVLALTRALGEQLGDEDLQPETWRWTDGGGSHVTCEFQDGKLTRWQLVRPEAGPPEGAPGAP